MPFWSSDVNVAEKRRQRRLRLASPVWLSAGLALLVLLVSIPVAWVVNDRVPEPYMDELFHVGQVRAYCDGAYTQWDPKITTPPALYVISLGWAHAMTLLHSVLPGAVTPPPLSAAAPLCAAPALRFVNVLLAAVTLYQCMQLVHQLHGTAAAQARAGHEARSFLRSGGSGGRGLHAATALKALECYLFPVACFFHFVYYTDTGSTCAVLFAFRYALAGRHAKASLALVVAMCFRQTNVVWCVFLCVYSLLRDFEESQPQRPTRASLNAEPDLARDAQLVHDLYHPSKLSHLFPSVVLLASFVYDQLGYIIARYWAYVCAAAGFVVFVVLNGGVVLGDKANHASRWHTPQLCYFFAFVVVGFGFKAVSFRKLRAFAYSLVRGAPLQWAVCTALMCVAIATQTDPAHPFLLADNRHFPFYLWKNVFRRWEWARYALLPLYQYGLWLVLRVWNAPPLALASDEVSDTDERRPSFSLLFAVLYVATTALSVVLSPLIEFRYFLVPFIVLQLHDREHVPDEDQVTAATTAALTAAQRSAVAASDVAAASVINDTADVSRSRKPASAATTPTPAVAVVTATRIFSTRVLVWNVLAFVAVNAAVFYVFLMRPFTWPDGSTARFMW